MIANHLLNPDLIRLAEEATGYKQAFVPAQGAQPPTGGGGADPSQGGGMPPDAMAAMGGGMPPPPPDAGGGGGGGFPMPPTGGGGSDPLQQIMQKLEMLSAGGVAGGAGGAIKPKIDVNVEMMQIKNMLAKICDALNINIPAQDMVATPEKLMAMSQGQSTATPAGGAPGAGAIAPMAPMGGMQPAGVPGAGGPEKAGVYKHNEGSAFDTSHFESHHNRAAALSSIAGIIAAHHKN